MFGILSIVYLWDTFNTINYDLFKMFFIYFLNKTLIYAHIIMCFSFSIVHIIVIRIVFVYFRS